jgi:hypothetical protein
MPKRPKSGLSPAAERFLKAFIAPSSKLIRGAATDRPPKTALRAVARDVDHAAIELGSDGFTAFFEELLALIRSEAAAGSLPPITVPEPTNDIETAVCAHFDHLEQRLPLATIIMIGGLGFGRPRQIESMYNTIRLSASVNRARGERKLELLRPFAWHVLENEYGPFLDVLIQADCAMAGQVFSDRDTVGALVREAQKRRLLGAHLWLDAGNVRNAAAHRGSWDYDVDRKVVQLSLRGRQPHSCLEYGSAALFRKLLDIVAESSSLRFALKRAYARDLMQVLGPAFIAYATTDEKKPLEAAYEPIEERRKSTLAALRYLGWKPAP